uniref:Uncharacterized protein n=1 Tax=Phaeomonas parva TaxID=124430 RepID=A0A7S1TS13_9STRA|mmetsp:Transcript_15256/g.45869  ORF Transcript_15256/g.45869 Transcript_15256/m.45869 type:complete len:183 (+) Transcript_15256:60-608(+)
MQAYLERERLRGPLPGVEEAEKREFERSRLRRDTWNKEMRRNQAESPRFAARRKTLATMRRRETLAKSEERAKLLRHQIEEAKAAERKRAERRRESWTKDAGRGRVTAAEHKRTKDQDDQDLAALLAAGDDPLGLTQVYSSRALAATGVERTLQISMSPSVATKHLALEAGNEHDGNSSAYY